MACSRACSGENGGQATSQSNSGDNERQWQQERLNREEAYYQFINALSDEDYRLMRDRNLLGTPDSETLGENITSNSLLEWLNTFHHTGNSMHSGQSGNQTWRAVSQANPSSGEFRFSLEININHEHNNDITPGEQLNEFLYGHSSRMHMENRPLIANSPVASRTRSRTLGNSVGHGFASSGIGNINGLLTQNAEETSRFFSGRLGTRNRSSASSTPNSLLDDNEHNIIRQRRTQRVTPVRLHRGRARTRRNARQRTEILRLRSTFSSQFQSLLESGQPMNIQQIHAGANRAHITQSSPEQTEEQAPSLGITLEEEESVRATAASRRHPSITLDLQVRRIRPRENRDHDSIATRTRSRVGMADNLVTLENDNEGFIQTVSRSEHAGIRTYVNTIRIPLHRVSDTGLGESSSVAVRSILRQIMTGFGELSSLMDTETGSEIERNSQHLSDMQPQMPNLDTSNNTDEFNATSHRNRLTERGSRERHGETNTTQHHHQNNSTQNSRASFVENGTLPILRLVPYLLLEEDSSDNLRGLTKDQIDNLSTRNYGNAHSEDDEISKTCSVCINEYVVGNKLRQLPCMHEFHFHCIDRWLSENSTCPICRQPVVT
ncbi:E3 ubiquitin-protein ligase RNF6 isoform X2 [Python bivittatus]|uniref:RING-type E3 ubiquitin transferase n=1 Tax=Python bivittatus TaxID=176946 RepID=A0A9F5MZU2_PYTBI|nr:E3 ubiquitin-protein ligase RNF6 isoform X2 [Python bivittatus]